MSIEEQDRLDLIRYRLAESKDAQSDVELLISHDRYRAAINRIYYSMFYSLLALGLKYEYDTSKHAQLIGWFNKTFIHPGLYSYSNRCKHFVYSGFFYFICILTIVF